MTLILKPFIDKKNAIYINCDYQSNIDTVQRLGYLNKRHLTFRNVYCILNH